MLQQLKQHILEQERLHGSTLIDLRRDFNTKLSRRLRGGGGGGFTIFVKKRGGTITINNVDHTTTIYDLKKKICAEQGTPHVDEQTLRFTHGNGDTLLDDVKTIGDYRIPDNGKIFLTWSGGNKNLYNVTIYIFVIINNERIPIQVRPHHDSIEHVKDKINNLLNIPKEQQTLTFRGHTLENDKHLAEYRRYGLYAFSEISLTVPRGYAYNNPAATTKKDRIMERLPKMEPIKFPCVMVTDAEDKKCETHPRCSNR